MDFTPASHKLPKWGDQAGMNFHLMPISAKASFVFFFFCSSVWNNWYHSIDYLHQLKLVVLSMYIVRFFPRQSKNRFNAVIGLRRNIEIKTTFLSNFYVFHSFELNYFYLEKVVYRKTHFLTTLDFYFFNISNSSEN